MFGIKAWYRKLDTKISSYEELKPLKSQRKADYTQQNENSLDSL